MNIRAIAATLSACILTGCAGAGSSLQPGQTLSAAQPFGRTPAVKQKGKGGQWVQFKPKTLGASYSAFIPGPDGNLWFIDENAAGLVRLSVTGQTKEFPLSGILNTNAVSMALGKDGDFYILDETSSVIRVTTSGKATVFPIPSGDGTSIDGIALGPDGNVWFAEFSHIGKITPAGKITEFPYPTGYGTNQYGGVSAGSDGNVWFAESSNNAIGRVDPSSGNITMFQVPSGCTPAPLVLAKDHNIWFACLGDAPLLGSITPNGTVATYAIGGAFGSNETEQFCAVGPDGEPWCASGNDGNIFRVDTSAHTVTTFTPPLGSGVRPDAVVAGPDGNVWVDTTGAGGEIDVLIVAPLTVKPDKLDFSGTGSMQTLTVSESGTTTWTAVSSDTSVATVVPGHSKSTFTVTSVALGNCKITIADSAGNSVAVKVTVK